jgi:hypothetical protein
MRMATALALTLIVGVSGLVGGSGKAYAVNLNIPGTECRGGTPGDQANIEYGPNNVVNTDQVTHYISCPVVRSPTSSNYSVSVYVDGWASSGNTIMCVLYSYNFDGTYLGSQSFPSALTGTFDQYLTVPGAFWSSASVVCSLPPGFGGRIYDIDVVQ